MEGVSSVRGSSLEPMLSQRLECTWKWIKMYDVSVAGNPDVAQDDAGASVLSLIVC